MSISYGGEPTTNLHQQLEKAHTMDEVMNVVDAELLVNRDKMYTDAPSCDFTAPMKLNPLLNEREIEDARWWYKYLDYGVILAWGELGAGKGVLLNRIAKLASWYYSKTVFLDYQPRELFDLQYVPSYYDKEYNNPHDPVLVKHTKYNIFNKQSFIKDLSRMAEASLGALADDASPDLEKIEKAKALEIRRLSGLWITQAGRVWLQNAVLVLDEIKRYHYYMRQNDPYGVMLTLLYDLLRHMHLCVLGMTAYYKELDPNKFLPKVTVEIKVHKSEKNNYIHFGEMSRSHWIEARGNRELTPIKRIIVDGREPWPLLGNYYYGELAQDIDEGKYNPEKDIRITPHILLKSTNGLRDINGVAWIENEYVGYALRSDEDGYTYMADALEGIKKGANYGIPNALIGVQRRMNWRINHCEPAAHKAGAVVYSGLGVYDIFDSEAPFDLPIAKSLKK